MTKATQTLTATISFFIAWILLLNDIVTLPPTIKQIIPAV